MQEKNQDSLIPEDEAAKIIGRAVQSMRNDRHKCQGLPYIKIGRSVRYSLQDIHEYIQRNRIVPGVRA